MSLSGFEREADIEERRKIRQEEWEKVRTADQPECEFDYKMLKKWFSSIENVF